MSEDSSRRKKNNPSRVLQTTEDGVEEEHNEQFQENDGDVIDIPDEDTTNNIDSKGWFQASGGEMASNQDGVSEDGGRGFVFSASAADGNDADMVVTEIETVEDEDNMDGESQGRRPAHSILHGSRTLRNRRQIANSFNRPRQFMGVNYDSDQQGYSMDPDTNQDVKPPTKKRRTSTRERDPDFVGFGRVKTKKRRAPLLLDQAMEEDIAQWYRANEILYNKRLKAHKDMHKKRLLFEEKAEELQMPVNDLKTWIDSMRTRYGRMTEPSGSGAGERTECRTERDQWIQDSFNFLEKHIVRVPKRRMSIKQKRKRIAIRLRPVPSTQAGPPPCNEEELEEEDPEPSNTSGNFSANVSANVSVSGSANGSASATKLTRKARHNSQDAEDFVEFVGRAEATQQNSVEQMGRAVAQTTGQAMVQPIGQPVVRSIVQPIVQSPEIPATLRSQWGSWLISMFSGVHESLWEAYLMSSFNNIMWYRAESAKLRQQERGQQQQQQQQSASQHILLQPPQLPLQPPLQTSLQLPLQQPLQQPLQHPPTTGQQLMPLLTPRSPTALANTTDVS